MKPEQREADAQLLALSRARQDSCAAHTTAINAKEEAEASIIKAHPELFNGSLIATLNAVDSGADADLEEIRLYLARIFPNNSGYVDEKAEADHAYLSEHRERIKAVLAEYGWPEKRERENESHIEATVAFVDLMRSPAQTPAGVLAKLETSFFPDERAEWADALADPVSADWEHVCLGSVYADLERLAARAP